MKTAKNAEKSAILKRSKRTGTKEWADHNVNFQIGCENGCLYCYAACMSIRFGRSSCQSWHNPVIDTAKVHKRHHLRSGMIMFPSSHDITNSNRKEALVSLKNMLDAGNDVVLVTKPRISVIPYICESIKKTGQLLFRFTIGSSNDRILRHWEPGASSFGERVECLKYAYVKGFRTSVSCEPMLDANIHAVVEAVHPLITDDLWMGKANRLLQTIAITCPGDENVKMKALELKGMQTDDAILRLYDMYKDDPIIRWKDSIKKVLAKHEIGVY